MATTSPNVVLGRTRDAASDRLLASGLRIFGQHGLQGVSTRQLAQAAGVNVAAIGYYFGGKEGCYIAVARHIVDCYAAPLRALAEEARMCLDAAPLDPSAERSWLERLLKSAAQTLLARSETTHVVCFVLREQLQPTAAFDVLYEGLIRPVHEAISLLTSRLFGGAADAPETILRAHAVLGQVLAFQTGRATILRRLGWPSYTPEQVEQIAMIAAEFACRTLGVDAPDRLNGVASPPGNGAVPCAGERR
ncbi:MAG TPA: CerR family C-terminal domain-containing protein [Pirellulales bacterium]|nr:CerR family C-terminal domain-containing protein [Pirellulales bacterium]